MKPSEKSVGLDQRTSDDKIPAKNAVAAEHQNTIRCQFKHSPIFGRFIEVDPLQEKTCPFDCLYCDKGKTIRKTVNPREFYPRPDAFHELELLLLNNPASDHIVIGGNGDPAICQNISLVIHTLHHLSKVPVAVASCGGLLWKTGVQSELSQADVVLASIDAPDKLIYQHINRPHQMVPYNRYINGLQEFRKGFRGEFWMRSTLVGGVNALDAEVIKLAAMAIPLRPSRIFLDTVHDNQDGETTAPTDTSRLHHFADFFPKGSVTVIERSPEKLCPAEKTHRRHTLSDGIKIRLPFMHNERHAGMNAANRHPDSKSAVTTTVIKQGNSGIMEMTDYLSNR